MIDDLPTNITKRMLWRYVNKKIKRSIHHYHVFSVLSILFDEMISSLKSGERIDIFNFGTLELKEKRPHRLMDIYNKKIIESKPFKVLSFKLNPDLKKILKDNLYLDTRK